MRLITFKGPSSIGKCIVLIGVAVAAASMAMAGEPLVLKGFKLRDRAPECASGWMLSKGIESCMIKSQTLLDRPLKELTIRAYKDRIIGVSAITGTGLTEGDALRDALTAKFGKPDHSEQRVAVWNQGDDRLVLFYDFQATAWAVHLADMAIDARMDADRAAATPAAKKRKADL